MNRTLLLLALTTSLTTAPATSSFGQSNPCDDPVYLRLVELDLDSMSDREFSVFQDKSAACTEFLLRHGQRAIDDTVIPDSLKPRYLTKGVSFRAHFNVTSWYLENARYFDKENHGGGLGFGLHYGVSKLVALVFNIDVAGMQPDFGEDFALVHGDLGVRFTFNSNEKKLRPFAQTLLTGFGAEQDYRDRFPQDTPVTVQVTGGGLSLGGGLMYFFNPSLALDVGLDFTFGQIDQVKYQSVAIDQNANTFSSRLNFGLAWYPWQR